MKKVALFSVAALFSIVLGLFVPRLLNNEISPIDNTSNSSILEQEIIGYSDTNNNIYKLYDKGQLIGVVKNIDQLKKDIKTIDFETDYEYSKKELGWVEDVYLVDETSPLIYEDIDKDIIDYLVDNDLIGIESKRIEIINNEGKLTGMLYVRNEEDFNKAKDDFILNFISQESLSRINNGEIISSPIEYGTVEKSITIDNKILITNRTTSPNNILDTVDKIYEYLCYGDNKERRYYTTIEGDTLAGVGSKNDGSMTARQIMMLNKDQIKDENQILSPGMTLNVAYYTSPLTVVVKKERLTTEIYYPDPVKYVETDSLPMGHSEISTKEQNGLKKVLYEETWINGVIPDKTINDSDGNSINPYAIKIWTDPTPEVMAIQGVVRIGTGTIVESGSAGTGNWRWPVSNPTITCDYYCYAGHGGVDFYNMYKPWDYVLAIDRGVVISKGWTDAGGYYCRIDHNNGYVTYYGHFSSLPYVEEGQEVEAGEVLGPIGMTGIATGPHVHLAMYENNVMINPCTVLNCSLLY